MEQLGEQKFQFKDKTFVLKLFQTQAGFSVVAFLNGHQVSPSYSVTFETHTDFFMRHKESLTGRLFVTAKSDIEQEMYFQA